MENFNLVHEFALVCGIVIILLILLLLGKKQPKYPHDYFLLALFVVVFFIFLHHYAGYYQIFWLFVSANFIVGGSDFIIGPLAYFYIKSLFVKVEHQKTTFWLTFLPYVLYTLIFTIPVSLSSPTEGLLFKYLHHFLDNPLLFYVVETFYLFFFIILALRLWNRYNPMIQSYYSNLTQADILWSKRLLWTVILYLVIDIGFTISETAVGESPIVHHFINVLTMLIVVLYLGYYGFFQAQLLLPSFLLERSKQTQSNKAIPKNVKPSIIFSQKEIKTIKAAIKSVLEKEKLYLKETLTLSELAESVQLTDKRLSTFINQELATNFYELVNQYRIAAFKSEIVLAENQNLTIWGVASKCGFNSKTSFNRIFKKTTGLTPSQYQKTLTTSKK